MKKGLAILLIFSYALVATGAAISFHYCGGNLKYIGFSPDKEDKGCCGTKKKDKCCKDKLVKVAKQDHRKAVSKISIAPLSFIGIIYFPEYICRTHNNFIVPNGSFHLRPPPLGTGTAPLYILHSSFLI
ncbi:MAG: hypothetical protein H0X33_05175 [Taibaiella sp.]|nr:hypothetical protein [Taibaiella sp.]